MNKTRFYNVGSYPADAELNVKTHMRRIGFPYEHMPILHLAAQGYIQRRRIAGVDTCVSYYIPAELGTNRYACSRLIVGYMYMVTPDNMGSYGQGVMFYSKVFDTAEQAVEEYLRLTDKLDAEVEDD